MDRLPLPLDRCRPDRSTTFRNRSYRLGRILRRLQEESRRPLRKSVPIPSYSRVHPHTDRSCRQIGSSHAENRLGPLRTLRPRYTHHLPFQENSRRIGRSNTPTPRARSLLFCRKIRRNSRDGPNTHRRHIARPAHKPRTRPMCSNCTIRRPDCHSGGRLRLVPCPGRRRRQCQRPLGLRCLPGVSRRRGPQADRQRYQRRPSPRACQPSPSRHHPPHRRSCP